MLNQRTIADEIVMEERIGGCGLVRPSGTQELHAHVVN